MRPYDTLFLAVAIGIMFRRPRNWWVAATIPMIAWATSLLPIGRGSPLVAAVAACLLVPRWTLVALVLAIGSYEDAADVIRITLLWLLVSQLVDGLMDGSIDKEKPQTIRQIAAQLLSVLVLYFTFLPMTFL